MEGPYTIVEFEKSLDNEDQKNLDPLKYLPGRKCHSNSFDVDKVQHRLRRHQWQEV